MHVWKGQLRDRIVELSDEEEVEWFAGKDVEVESDLSEGFVLVRAGGSRAAYPLNKELQKSSILSGQDFVGMGKLGAEGKILYSFLPKERRRRERG